jgi:hypothetical protein
VLLHLLGLFLNLMKLCDITTHGYYLPVSLIIVDNLGLNLYQFFQRLGLKENLSL